MLLSDLPAVLDLVNREGWMYDMVDMERILRIDSECSIVAETDGQMVGLATVIRFGDRGVIGHLVIKEGWRKKGIGDFLLDTIIADMDSKGIGTIELYAAPHARDYYPRKNFRGIGDVTIYFRESRLDLPKPKKSQNIRTIELDEIDDILAMDKPILEVDRRKMIEDIVTHYPDLCLGQFEDGRLTGYALGRSASGICDIGPWIMGNPTEENTSSMFIELMTRMGGEPTFMCAPTDNNIATDLMTKWGFSVKSVVRRMVRTKQDIKPFTGEVMAVAALEFA